MVIPYHVSGLNKAVAEHNGIDAFKDFTSYQNTAYKASNGKWVKLTDEMKKEEPDFNENLRKLGDPRLAAKVYLDWCKQNGYRPKFHEFADHPGYYKMLEDFRTISVDEEGKEAIFLQGPVKLNFPEKMKEYVEEGLNEDDVLQGRMDSETMRIAEEAEQAMSEAVVRAEIAKRLAQEYKDAAKAKAKEKRDQANKLMNQSKRKTITAEQAEAFRNEANKLREEAKAIDEYGKRKAKEVESQVKHGMDVPSPTGAEFSVAQERERTEATRVANDAVMECLSRGGIEVERVTQEEALAKAEAEGVNLLETPGGKVYGWAENGKIYLTEEGMDANTPIHEYTHLWVEAIKKSNPKGWSSIVKVLKESPVWAEVMEDGAYEKIRGNEDAVASEVLSRLSGEKGRRMFEEQTRGGASEATVIDRVRRAVRSFWAWVGKNLFGIQKFKSVDEITDRVLYDLTRGTKLDKGEKDRTLVGVHNIDEYVLRKAMESGALINPSVGVIDVARQLHKSFGDISLVMPSEKLNNSKDGSGGTYTGDAWTPMVPREQVVDNPEFDKRFEKEFADAPEWMGDVLRNWVRDYLFTGKANPYEVNFLDYIFLQRRGVEVAFDDSSYLTAYRAEEYVEDNGLTEERDAWRNDVLAKLKPYAKKLKVIADTEIPFTVENASRYMNSKLQHGDGLTYSLFMSPYENIEDLHKYEDLLTGEKADTLRWDDEWNNKFNEFSEAYEKEIGAPLVKLGGNKVWAEIFEQEKPAEYLEECFGIELSPKLAEQLQALADDVRNNRPDRYFETKFQRPVKFNEFAAAVVPEDTPADVVDFLRSQGLQIETYERGNDASRRAAMDKATQKEGVRFSVGNKKTPVTDRPNRANEKPVSGSVHSRAKGDSSSNANVTVDASTNIENNTLAAKNNLKKFFNNDYNFKEKFDTIANTLKNIGGMFKMRDKKGTKYTLLRTHLGNTVTIRIGDHLANGNNFEQDNADLNVSIVIENRIYDKVKSDIEYLEGVITLTTWRNKPMAVVDAIAKGIQDVLEDKPFTLPKDIGDVKWKGGKYNVDENESSPLLRRGGFGSAMEELKLEGEERDAVRGHAESVAREMGIEGDVTFVDGSEEGLAKDQMGAKAWMDPESGKVTVNLANAEGAADVEASLLHEGAGHKGLRAMFGEKFKQFLGNVWDAMPEELRRRAFEGARKYGWDLHTGTEEVLSEMAEKGEFKKYDKFFNRLKGFFGAMLRASGLRSGELSDNELQYVLWQSYRGLQGKNTGLVAKAERIAMEHALGIGRFSKKNNPNRGESAGVESTWARFSLIFGLTRYSDSS